MNYIKTIGLLFLVAAASFHAGAAMTPAEAIQNSLNEYQYNLNLVNEESQRIDMWKAANEGKDVTADQLDYLKYLIDNFVSREDTAIRSGDTYRGVLASDTQPTQWELDEMARVDRNRDIMNSDKAKMLDYYRTKSTIEQPLKQINTMFWILAVLLAATSVAEIYLKLKKNKTAAELREVKEMV